jgi:hypothetical protein
VIDDATPVDVEEPPIDDERVVPLDEDEYR